MGLSEFERAQIAQRAKAGLIPVFPEGPRLERFDALQLAQAIERLLSESAERGHTKCSVHMDMVDAQALATFLRKHGGTKLIIAR